jgi:hypothetical protein
MSSFSWLKGSGKQGAACNKVSANSNATTSRTLVAATAPELFFWQATRSRLLPTDPLIRQRKTLTKLPPRQALPSQEACSTREERARVKRRWTQPRSTIQWDVSSQARTRKRTFHRAVEDRAKAASNGHLRRPPIGTSWRDPQRVRLGRLVAPL